ncbi:MAG: DUF1315 family protein [Psychromonas sp.]|nr:DUF1315 family protein [Psychromonas sp.]
MKNITDYVKKISPSLFDKLKTAVEIGKWEDGKALSERQKEEALQLVLAYQSAFNETPDHFTITKDGELYMKKRWELKKQFSKDTHGDIHNIAL